MDSFFAGTRPGTRVTSGSATFDLPILYFRDDVCALFMTADYAAVRRLMPSDRLHPAALPQKGAFRAALRPSGSFLELGDHAVADSIRELGVGTAPLLTRCYVDRAAILPTGRVVEELARPVEGCYGTDRVGECRVSDLED